jgi:Zn-dependent peptidase ImmA (M78 family)
MVETYSMRLAWDEVPELPNERIVAELHPKARTIVLNRRHRGEFLAADHPVPFALAHQLGHWLYDADHARSLMDHPVFCRSRATSDTARVRELNADGFAMALLVPTTLYRAEISRGRPLRRLTSADLDTRASAVGIPVQALRTRYEQLGLARWLPQERSAGTFERPA